MRLALITFGLATLVIAQAPSHARAQVLVMRAIPDRDAPAGDGFAHRSDITGDLNRQPAGRAGPRVPSERAQPERDLSPWAATSRDVWRDAAPVGLLEPAGFEGFSNEQAYSRRALSFDGYTPSGLEVSLTPYAGIGLGEGAAAVEAGATLRIGRGLDRLAPDGASAFGDRPRWYVYAAGSGRAVGYNFARDRDGAYSRSGYSHDSGAFLGDAQLGVAVRRGAMQSSIGLVYRELDPGALRSVSGMDTDVSEGLVAFQLSIKP